MAEDTPTRASEELLAAPLPDMVRNLGIAVAEANRQLSTIKSNKITYQITKAEIDLKVALSIHKGTATKFDGGLKISVFNVNASYSKTFDFKEEASSHIKVFIQATNLKPEPETPPEG